MSESNVWLESDDVMPDSDGDARRSSASDGFDDIDSGETGLCDRVKGVLDRGNISSLAQDVP